MYMYAYGTEECLGTASGMQMSRVLGECFPYVRVSHLHSAARDLDSTTVP